MITTDQARPHYTENDSAHGFDHVLRVWRLARRIGAIEGAEIPILQAAALLHDIGRAEQARSGRCHAAVGAERAREILRGTGATADEIDRVATAIAQHRYRADGEPNTIEGKVLFDADKLDAIGAVGVARAYIIAGVQGQRLWAEVPEAYKKRPRHEGKGDLASDEHTPVHEFHYKLVRLRERLYTKTGQDIAEERHRFMVSFFERLGAEVAAEQ